jgi:hypothetical protein
MDQRDFCPLVLSLRVIVKLGYIGDLIDAA